jgi:hypothetical protein
MRTAADIRYEFLDAFQTALNENSLTVMHDTIWLLVWDDNGNCRAYSTHSDNFHFAVVRLNGKCKKYAVRFRYSW